MKFIQHHTGKFFNIGQLRMQYGFFSQELVSRLNLKEFRDIMDTIDPDDLGVEYDATRVLANETVVSDITYNPKDDVYERSLITDKNAKTINHDFVVALLERIEALETQVNNIP